MPIKNPDRLVRKYLNGEDRAEENTHVFRGELDQARKTNTWDQAVGKIVYDAAWYSRYDREVTWYVLQMSDYRNEVTGTKFAEIFQQACEDQDGYYGDWKQK